MNVAALDGSARLPGVAKSTPHCRSCRVLELGVFENDHRILAAQFEHHRSKMSGGGFGNSLPGCDTAGEYDFVNHSIDQRGAGGSIAGNNFKESFRKLGLLKDFANLQRGKWSKLAWFHYDRIAGHQSHHDLVEGSGPGKVPWGNDSHHTQRLVNDP